MRYSNSALFSALFVLAGLLTVSCSPTTRTLFFDIPAKSPEPKQSIVDAAEQSAPIEQPESTSIAATMLSIHPADNENDRPPIEEASTWEEAQELLPNGAMGQPDWGAALSNEVIKPRALDPADRDGAEFKLDFYLKGANPMFDAYFPHSSHLKWMSCDSCHPAVFKYRDNEMSMAAINKGEYCGACHGKVAFQATACKRCHTNM